jgi:endonuclease G
MNNLKSIAKGEENLVNEVISIVDSGNNLPLATRQGINSNLVKAVVMDTHMADTMPHVEAVIVPFMRPVLFIINNQIEIPESNELKERIIKYKSIVERPLRSVGRIELINHQFKNVGTGWLISENIIVTNKHVAQVFALKESNKKLGGIFKKNFLGLPIGAKIDFKEEYQPDPTIKNQFEVDIDKIIYLPDEIQNSPDIALLRIKPNNSLPDPISFVKDKLFSDQLIGVIGYPFQDPRGVTDKEMEKRIFGEVFGVKRYSPGQIIDPSDNNWYFLHDATTLGGNSGSLVQDMETGCAIGIHFSGMLLEANYAVKGKEILDASTKAGVKNVISFSRKETEIVLVQPEFPLEAKFDKDSYADRKGFDTKFLNPNDKEVKIPLPKITNKPDVLKFGDNDKLSILKYTHFSLEMSKSRRLCYYSAVNIDGKQSEKLKRPGWRYDARIPENMQIMKECYGNSPKFARGHMTRREDPNWGELASLGNDDSMHVTNTVPQMQPFNGGVWLTLENYALENARQDDQKISVFTGPFLRESDPVKFNVQIPVEFWKIIAFIHDETNKLCATGYTISQEDYILNEEFVYGEFETYQVPIKLIEKKSGLSFGKLSTFDPLANEIFESIPSPIKSLRQVRFLKE